MCAKKIIEAQANKEKEKVKKSGREVFLNNTTLIQSDMTSSQKLETLLPRWMKACVKIWMILISRMTVMILTGKLVL